MADCVLKGWTSIWFIAGIVLGFESMSSCNFVRSLVSEFIFGKEKWKRKKEEGWNVRVGHRNY